MTSHTLRRQRHESDRYSIRAVDRALDILLAFVDDPAEHTLSELASISGLEKPTVHRLVRTLEAREFVERRDNGRYALGKILSTLGMLVVESWTLRDLIEPTLVSLVHETHETAFCSILDGSDVLTIASVPGRQRLRLAIVPGERAPAAITADGKVLLAHLSPEEALRRIAVDTDAYPSKSRPWLRRLLAELDTVRQTNVGYDLEEHAPDLRAVAVPLRDQRGKVRAAVAVSAPTSRLPDERLPDVVDVLRTVTPPGVSWGAAGAIATD
jgi:DNA-binding IclR family transcriptional regulator